jgi:hypothetical protein
MFGYKKVNKQNTYVCREEIKDVIWKKEERRKEYNLFDNHNLI